LSSPSLNDAIHSTVVATSAFCVLYDRNPHFTGRDPLLERLHLALHDTRPKQYNHRISLHGLGGVGKTQIALEYAYRHKSHYQYVFWISAVDQAKLLSGFGSIAKATRCVNLTSIQQPDEAAKSVLKWLEITEKCLLVIDNLDDFAIVDGYLPSTTSAVHTLITTRNKFSNRIPAEGFEIMTMGPEESVEFLTQRIKLPNSQSSQVLSEAPKIVKELGYLPLAMEQAAAYICESENIVEFLTTFKESRRELLARRTAGNSYPYTIATTWRMSLKGLESLCPNSIVLLQFLVFLNPDEILVEFLKAGASGLKSELRAIIADNFRFRECLIALQSFSLIRVFGGAEKIGIHRLVQGVIKDDLNAQQQAGLLSNAVQLGLQSFPSMSDLSKRETCRRYLSQVIPFLGGNNRITDSKWQILVDRIAHYLHEDGFYFDCFRWSRLLFETRSSVLGLEHPGMLRSMQNLAASYRSLGQFKESAQLDGETLDIQKRVLGSEHPDTLRTMNGLASSYWSLGQFREAAQLYGETLDIQKRVLGSEHPGTLRSINGLASSYWSLGQVREAAQLNGETLDIQKRVLGSEHPDTLRNMNSLASSYWSLGQFREAARLYGETLDIQNRVLGSEHPDTLRTMNGLAVSYRDVGQVKEAARLHKETVEIQKRVLGSEPPNTIRSMKNLELLYREHGLNEEEG
jgi:tetratricopeptide (TPR) repeat protein